MALSARARAALLCLWLCVAAPAAASFLRGAPAVGRGHAVKRDGVALVDGYDNDDGTITNLCECGMWGILALGGSQLVAPCCPRALCQAL
jgi:hypothetical protein